MIDLQYEYEERAAIMEFDGGLCRNEAERRAKIDFNIRNTGYKHRQCHNFQQW